MTTSRTMALLSLCLATACATACATAGDGAAVPDDGPGDARPGDARPGDARPDAPPLDASAGDANPDAAAPDACVPAWIDLLTDGDFDAGGATWTQTTNGGNPLVRQNLPYPPQSGTHAALLMGFNNAVQSLAQAVTVPADATALRVTGFRCLVTEETTQITPFDTVRIELRVPGGAALEELDALSNLDAGAVCDWDPFELTAALPHAGEPVELAFTAAADAASITSMGFDTLSLAALACPP